MTKKSRRTYGEKLDEIREQRGGVCKICGGNRNARKKKLQFAHVKPTNVSGMSRGSWKRYYDIKNNPDCYEILCIPCHNDFDCGKYEYDEVTKTFTRTGKNEVPF